MQVSQPVNFGDAQNLFFDDSAEIFVGNLFFPVDDDLEALKNPVYLFFVQFIAESAERFTEGVAAGMLP